MLIESHTALSGNNIATLRDGAADECGQAFTGNGQGLSHARFRLRRSSSPTGDITARLYAHTGTFGFNGKPTGAVLSESDPIEAATITNVDYTWYEFTFPTEYTLVDGTKYCLAVAFAGGGFGIGHILATYSFGAGATHAGNFFTRNETTGLYGTDGSSDTYFEALNIEEPAVRTPNEIVITDRNARSLGKKYYTDVNFPYVNSDTVATSTYSLTDYDIQRSIITRYFDKDTKIMIFWNGYVYKDINAVGEEGTLSLVIDSVPVGPEISSSADNEIVDSVYHYVTTLEQGEHTIGLALRTTDVNILAITVSYFSFIELTE